jgi:hypothetical protein
VISVPWRCRSNQHRRDSPPSNGKPQKFSPATTNVAALQAPPSSPFNTEHPPSASSEVTFPQQNNAIFHNSRSPSFGPRSSFIPHPPSSTNTTAPENPSPRRTMEIHSLRGKATLQNRQERGETGTSCRCKEMEWATVAVSRKL